MTDTQQQMFCFRDDFTQACSLEWEHIELLAGIQGTGSLQHAAQPLGRIRYANVGLHGSNYTFSEPVSTASIGGRGGGGMTLKAFGVADREGIFRPNR